jgi:hypothetical protein
MLRATITFVLSNYSLTFLVVGLIFSAGVMARANKPLSASVALEKLLAWHVFWAIGVCNFYNFVMHGFFGARPWCVHARRRGGSRLSNDHGTQFRARQRRDRFLYGYHNPLVRFRTFAASMAMVASASLRVRPPTASRQAAENDCFVSNVTDRAAECRYGN